MTILAKAAGHNRGAQDGERYQRDQHHRGEADEMFDILEQVIFLRLGEGACAEEMRDALGYPGLARGTMIEVTGACDSGHHEAVLSIGEGKRGG